MLSSKKFLTHYNNISKMPGIFNDAVTLLLRQTVRASR